MGQQVKQILVPVDADAIPEGYEAVRFGSPKTGEIFLTCGGATQTCDTQLFCTRIILRRKWAAPEWMRKSKIEHVKRINGHWFAYIGGVPFDISWWGLPFDPPFGDDVPDSETLTKIKKE